MGSPCCRVMSALLGCALALERAPESPRWNRLSFLEGSCEYGILPGARILEFGPRECQAAGPRPGAPACPGAASRPAQPDRGCGGGERWEERRVGEEGRS